VEEALAHWSTARIDGEYKLKGATIVAKRVNKEAESSGFGFALCEISGSQQGMFALVMRDGVPTRYGYMRKKAERYQFERTPVPGWDSAELIQFALQVVELEFSYLPEWAVTLEHDDLEASALAAVRRMKLPRE